MLRSLSTHRLAFVAVLACVFTATSLVFDHQTVQIKIGAAFAKGAGGGGASGGDAGHGAGDEGHGAGDEGHGASDAGHGHGGASGSAGAGSSGGGASGNAGAGASGGSTNDGRSGRTSPGLGTGALSSSAGVRGVYSRYIRRIVHPIRAPAAPGHSAGQATSVTYGYPVEIAPIEGQSPGRTSDQPSSPPSGTDPDQDRVNHALLESVGIVSRAMPNWLRDMSASEAITWVSAVGVLAGLLAVAVRSRRREFD